MQATERSSIVTASQLSLRDVAQLYREIEENTEFLTNIIRHQPGRHRPIFSQEMNHIEIQSFLNVIVQASYLFYTCNIRKVSLYLSKEPYANFLSGGTLEIIYQFMLEKQFVSLSEGQRDRICKSFIFINPYKHQNSYADSLLLFMDQNIKALKTYINKKDDSKLLSDKVTMDSINSFEQALNIIVPYSQTGIKPKTLITCLEQTKLFRVNSCLLKVLNCSMYENLRSSNKLQQLLAEVKTMQKFFNQKIHKSLLNDNKVDIQIIQEHFQNFFQHLLKCNFIAVDESKSSSNKVNKIMIVQETKESGKFLKWRLLVKEKIFTEFSMETLLAIERGVEIKVDETSVRPNYTLFQIEYSVKKNEIATKYISNVEAASQNIDAILFHCNNMMLEWNNVVLEQIERIRLAKNNVRRKEKFFGFKHFSQLSFKDSPFINILLQMDLVMTYGKLNEFEMRRKTIRMEDHVKFANVSKRINHLIGIFISKVKRLYQSQRK